MAKELNKVQITGRLGAAPELRQTRQGHLMAQFRVASNRRWRSSDGISHEDTEWFRVVAWNRLAELCQHMLDKGTRVYIEGRLQTRTWSEPDGQQRMVMEVVASDLIALDAQEQQATVVLAE